MSGAAIRFDGATVRYPGSDRSAIDDVSFECGGGELVVLLGPSGCGKSTLLRTVNRLVPLDAGRVFIDGTDVARARPRRAAPQHRLRDSSRRALRAHDGRAERRRRAVAARLEPRDDRARASTSC